MRFIQPIKLGNLSLRSNIFYAPLAGCSDFPFRQMASFFNPGLIFCEMVKMDALVRSDPGTFRLLDFCHDMHPIGAQICGSKKKYAALSARIIEDMGFDLIDLNCGCPVDKVTKDGSGSGMLKTPELIGELIEEMVSAVKIPVTVKIRAGWDDHTINAPKITLIAESAGASAITVHGRTRVQGYKGPANWDYIKECTEVATQIKVIGNGDIFSHENAEQIFQHTSCDAILVSRGTLGQPWIAEDIELFLNDQPIPNRVGNFLKEQMLRHLSFIRGYRREKKALLDLRRVGCWYLKKAPGAKKLRDDLSRLKDLKLANKLIEHYPWELA